MKIFQQAFLAFCVLAFFPQIASADPKCFAGTSIQGVCPNCYCAPSAKTKPVASPQAQPAQEARSKPQPSCPAGSASTASSYCAKVAKTIKAAAAAAAIAAAPAAAQQDQAKLQPCDPQTQSGNVSRQHGPRGQGPGIQRVTHDTPYINQGKLQPISHDASHIDQGKTKKKKAVVVQKDDRKEDTKEDSKQDTKEKNNEVKLEQKKKD